MTGTQIRDALREVSHAVDVPAPDRVAFERLVRAERVRRRTRRGLAIGAAAAVAVLVGGTVLTGLPDGDGGGAAGSDKGPATATDPAPGGPEDWYTPALLEGELVWVGRETTISTGQEAAGLVGSTTSNLGALVVDDQERVWWVRETRIAGEPARTARADGEPVQAAVVDRTGSWLTYVDAQGAVHVRLSYDDERDVATGDIGDGELLAGDGTVWLVRRDGQVSVEGPGASRPLAVGEDATGAQIGGDTVAVQTGGGASFFDLESGQPLQLDLGGAVGGLSTDGTWYATSASAGQRADGMSPDLDLVDTHTGEMHALNGYDPDGQVLSVWWADDDRFAVLSRNDDHRAYWECSVAADFCTQVYDDPTGTLTLPVQ